jgi:NADPH-ferrihemoprotein reductase
MELSVAGSGMRYIPGDSIGVLPCNDPALVDALLVRLGQDGSRVFSVAALGSSAAPAAPGPRLLPHLKWPCTLRHAFLVGCDLTSTPRYGRDAGSPFFMPSMSL